MVFTKKFVVFFFFLVLIVCEKSEGHVLYRVGDSAGWTSLGHVDYRTWAATKNFHVGDIICKAFVYTFLLVFLTKRVPISFITHVWLFLCD